MLVSIYFAIKKLTGFYFLKSNLSMYQQRSFLSGLLHASAGKNSANWLNTTSKYFWPDLLAHLHLLCRGCQPAVRGAMSFQPAGTCVLGSTLCWRIPGLLGDEALSQLHREAFITVLTHYGWLKAAKWNATRGLTPFFIWQVTRQTVNTVAWSTSALRFRYAVHHLNTYRASAPGTASVASNAIVKNIFT